MTDSDSFTSLMALVDSHLSKVNVQESRSDYIPGSGSPWASVSDTRLTFTQRLPIPNFGVTESPIQTVLAEQVSNMLKAKEINKRKEEEKIVAEQMKQLTLESDDNCIIDLMQALQTPCATGPPCNVDAISSSSSMESLFEPKFIDCDVEDNSKSPEPLLPCTTDISDILYKKIKMGKGSAFGKVLTSRLKATSVPYDHVRTYFSSDITPFDFSTPSPDDIVKEKQRKPTMCSQYTPDIVNFV